MKQLTAQQFLSEAQKLQAEKPINFAQAVRHLLNGNKAIVGHRDKCWLSTTCFGRMSCDLLLLVEFMSNHCLDDFRVARFAGQVASMKCLRR